MRFSIWNVRSLYRAGLLKAAARESARYKLDLLGVQEVRWDKEGTGKQSALQYAIRRVQVIQDSLILNGTHQLSACADYIGRKCTYC
jgi:exonuclease III